MPHLSYKWLYSVAELSSNREATKRFKVHEKHVREWKLQKKKLKQLCVASKKRLLGGRGRPRWNLIVSSIYEMRSQNLKGDMQYSTTEG